MSTPRCSRFSFFIGSVILLVFYFRGLPSLVRPEPPAGWDPVRRPKLRFAKSSFDWSAVKQYYPPASLTPLPKGTPKRLRGFQHDFGRYRDDKKTEARRLAVRKTFLRSWRAYKTHAWLQDELAPVSGASKNTFGGWAATMIDSLDSLWIMGLTDEFYEAAQAAVQLDWANTTEGAVNLFETTIRHLGGLLSAYDLSRESALLDKAKELGDMILMGFDTPNRLPGFWINFEDALNGRQVAGTNDPSASPTSLGLELTRLAQLTGDDRYYDAIDRVRAFLARTQDQSLLPGMWPVTINFQAEQLTDNSFALGALADSLYEYLPKMYILTGGLEPSYEGMYRRAMDAVERHVLFRPMLPGGDDILLAGTTFVHDDGIHLVPEMQHLACFAGGMFLLGGKTFGFARHLRTGERLTRGCAWAYAAFPTGLMPEYSELIPCPPSPPPSPPMGQQQPPRRPPPCEWDAERWAREGDGRLARGFRHARDPRYALRPEAAESLFLLWRMTGREELRDRAWAMFESIVAATETALAHSAVADVTAAGETVKLDSMESFWLAETLKYFYLIFSPPDVISLDEFVLNTEAHPFRRPGRK